MSMRSASGTLELEIQIGTEVAVVTVAVSVDGDEGGWSVGLQTLPGEQFRLEGEFTFFTVPAPKVRGTRIASDAAEIRAVFHHG